RPDRLLRHHGRHLLPRRLRHDVGAEKAEHDCRHRRAVLSTSLRDESLHLAFGCDLINTIEAENPEIWTAELQSEIVGLIKRSVELESKHAHDACPQGLLGINPETFSQYVEHIADRRLERIGLAKVYKVENPFPWMSQSTV